MPEFDARQLAAWSGGRWTAPPGPLRGFSVDTRTIRRGEAFVALRTPKRDGHAFLGAAQAAGAGAAIVAAADASCALSQLVVADPLAALQAIARAHRRAFAGRVVGISGSAGKTSTKDLLALLLGGASGVHATEVNPVSGPAGEPLFPGRVLATEGNLNNHLGVPLTLTRLDPREHDVAVIEAGISAPGEMQPLADMIAPDVAVITLVAAAHTEALGGIAGVAREKAVLPAATRSGGLAIFPRPVAEFPAFRALGGRTLVVERADPARADRAEGTARFRITHAEAATTLVLASGFTPPLELTCRRVSDGMAQNLALAACAALWLGVSPSLIQARVGSWQPAKWRGELRREAGRLLYLDCYNANPASMADALAAFTSVAPASEPRLFLIGCMEELGPEAAAHHRELGRSLELREGDRVFVIGTHADEVRAGVAERGGAAEQVQVITSLAAVAPVVAAWRGAVFVKGSRRYQLEQVLPPAGSPPPPC
jgi:UDP-N-acetylmuramoyl-tripeptide--D-alanyl-D-alanine ligase